MLRTPSQTSTNAIHSPIIPILSESFEEHKPARRLTSLVAVVKGRDGNEQSWKEEADVVGFSASGASFHVARSCAPGQLLSLLMPLPIHLRAYDHDKKLYKVWGIVQHCQQVARDAEASHFVGVAFIGKTAPESYHENAHTSYRICGMNGDGLWIAKEAEKPFINRKEPRFSYSMDISLYVLDAEQKVLAEDRTETENISENGSLVISDLDVLVGDRIRFHSVEFEFTALAVVRNRQKASDGRSRVSLEFVDDLFPVSELNPSIR
jgi:hypothetical protein